MGFGLFFVFFFHVTTKLKEQDTFVCSMCCHSKRCVMWRDTHKHIMCMYVCIYIYIYIYVYVYVYT